MVFVALQASSRDPAIRGYSPLPFRVGTAAFSPEKHFQGLQDFRIPESLQPDPAPPHLLEAQQAKNV
jgi:hypothetical protein